MGWDQAHAGIWHGQCYCGASTHVGAVVNHQRHQLEGLRQGGRGRQDAGERVHTWEWGGLWRVWRGFDLSLCNVWTAGGLTTVRRWASRLRPAGRPSPPHPG